MFERFTEASRGVVVRAHDEAERLRHPYIGTEHLLLGMLSPEAGIAYTVLHDAGLDAPRVRADIERLTGFRAKILSDDDAEALRTVGIDLDAVLARIEESFGPGALDPEPPTRRRGPLRRRQGGRTPFTQRAKKVLGLALREAVRLGHHYIGTEHILLGLLRDGTAARILTNAGLRLDDLRAAVVAAIGKAA